MRQNTSTSQDAGRDPVNRQRFLSEADCREIGQRIAQASVGGGVTTATIWSHWSGHIRWARNQLVTSGDVRNNYIKISRNIRGARNNFVLLNQATNSALVAATRRAERLATLNDENPEWDLSLERYTPEQSPVVPNLFSETTYQLDAEHRARTALALTKASAEAGMMSAGNIDVSAHSVAVIDSRGHVQYVSYTQAGYSVTVRDPTGSGSGWAGVDWPDWSHIDTTTLTATALDKCLKSRNPVRVEPGRYTTILEPQAVSDFVSPLLQGGVLSKQCGENDDCSPGTPFLAKAQNKERNIIGMSKLGSRLIDERISIWIDPTDPELSLVPFSPNSGGVAPLHDIDVFHPASWIKNGVLTELEYNRKYAIAHLHRDTGLPNSGGFRMSGGTTSVDEMISTTKRGLLVTRFDRIIQIDYLSQLYSGYTRDGLWLIENGKISKPVKNLVFTESILFALNKVEQLGVPQRSFSPSPGRLELPMPTMVPSLKINDFSFTALTDAV